MLIELQFVLAFVLVLALLIMSILDFSLSGANKIALRRIADRSGARRSSLLDSLADTRAEVLMVIHISIQILLIGIAVLLTHTFLMYPIHFALALGAAAGSTLVLVLVFRQLIPRAIALRNAEMVLARLIPALAVPYFVLRPLAGLIFSMLNRFRGWEAAEPEDEEEASEEEIQAFIDAGQEEGILEQDEGAMIQSIVQFGDKLALEVMTPRTQIVAVDAKEGIHKIIDVVASSRHSRVPVYRDQLDNVEGVVHASDLLRLAHDGRLPADVRSLLHDVDFVPETKPIDDLLEEMRDRGQQFVLVVDEYGGISGLITIEDLVEEIVGDINDGPSEMDAVRVQEESPGAYLVPGGKELSSVDALLGSSIFPETECTTIGGAVVELFGRLPATGERIRHEGVAIDIVDADRRKIRRLRIRVPAGWAHPKAEHG
jgi:putative hemolysin